MSIRFADLLWCDASKASYCEELLKVDSSKRQGHSRVSAKACGCLESNLEALFAHCKKSENVINSLFNPLRYSQRLRLQVRVAR